MAEQIKGALEFINGNSKVTVVVDGDHATIKVGVEGTGGRITVVNGKGKETFQFKTENTACLTLGAEGYSGQLILTDAKGQLGFTAAANFVYVGSKGLGGHLEIHHADDSTVFSFNSQGAQLSVGALNGHPGKLTIIGGGKQVEGDNGRLIVQDGAGRNVFQVSGADARLGAEGKAGSLQIVNDKNRVVFQVSGEQVLIGDEGGAGELNLVDERGNIWLVLTTERGLIVGNQGTPGHFQVRHSDGSYVFVFNGDDPDLMIGDANHAGRVTIYGGKSNSGNQSGKLILKDDWGRDVFQVNGSTLRLGAKDAGGRFSLIESSGAEHISFDGFAVRIGGDSGGNLSLRNIGGKESIQLSGSTGNITVGAVGSAGSISVIDFFGNKRINILGNEGDIELLGADCAEEFDMVAEVEPATVMVIDAAGGKLRPCDEAYDRKVAGVISGGGTLSPGIMLDRQGGAGRSPVALAGKVMCKVDAQYGPVEIGDLLTTSPTAGHAMRVEDPARAFGAVIGKALKPLKAGVGLIPILIALQ
ncbi:MAG TPA: hypothetical protein VF543_05510 [Pyrinomonadaceae bacterium]|jgi:hypothetical protein